MLHSRHSRPRSERPHANDRPHRPDAPRARRLRRRDADTRVRSGARRLTYLDARPDVDGSAHLDPGADVDANPYACTNVDAHAYSNPYA